jgi:small subunit ribosomal protein S2
MAVVTMRQLLESGVHFGHQTRRWNPKMKRFIFTERNGIYIIDLQQSLSFIDRAYEFVRETVAHGGTVLFVGTKKQAQEPIAEQAARVGMPYVNQRWLGGMLTNFQTVHKRLQRLKELELLDFDDVAGSGMTKKELLVLRREKDKLEKTLGGIRDMARVPSAVWIVDTKKEHLAVDEARKLNIPIVAILDTNCDPDEVDYKIPGNDDAIRSVTLLTRVVADAVADGLMSRSRGNEAKADSGVVAVDEPLAEWERELLAGQQADAAPAAGPAEAAVEAPADAAAAADVAAEPVAEVAAEPVAEVVAEVPADTAAAAEAPAEVAAEPVAEVVAEPIAEVAAEPVAEVAAEPVAEVAAEPVAEVAAEPVAEVAAEPVAEVAAEPPGDVEASAPEAEQA